MLCSFGFCIPSSSSFLPYRVKTRNHPQKTSLSLMKKFSFEYCSILINTNLTIKNINLNQVAFLKFRVTSRKLVAKELV